MRRTVTGLLLAMLSVASAEANNRYDPRLRFRALVTPRFDVYFHQGTEPHARRLAALAESVATDLEPRLGRPRARVHVIVVNQTDVANGWATPLPYNLIEIVTASPRAESLIGNTSDWLRLVFIHEYTHVLHLERSRGFLGAVGKVFGRNPFFYPNLALPTWQIEGLATYYESAATGEGRIPAGDFKMIVGRAKQAGRFFDLDRASSSVVQWPGGQAPYLYGGLFHKYLADTYGEESLARLADATAGRLPFFGSPAFKKVFKKSLGALWDDFERATPSGPAPSSSATRLTYHGFAVNDPWFSASGELLYSVANPHGFPALMAWAESGPKRLANRFGGQQISAHGERIFFDQLEYVSSVGLQSDLYVREEDGAVRRLTHGARASDPDVSPDGTTLVCVVQRPEGRALATVPVAGGEPTILWLPPGGDFASPRWGPEGSRIIAEYSHPVRGSALVIVNVHDRDREVRVMNTVVASARGRNATPVWSRDGRHVYFASDRDGGPFRLFSFEFQGARLRRLADADVANAPALSPDGQSLVYAGYTPEGYDLFSIPLAEARWEDVRTSEEPSAHRGGHPGVSAAPDPDDGRTGRPYSPLSTLLPRFWTPIVEEDGDSTAFGAATGGSDALGRHGYYASAAWSTRGRPDWAAGYAYDRWRPTFFVDASDDQERFREGDIRIREFNAGAMVAFRRVRRTQTLVGSYHTASERLTCASCAPGIEGSATRRALRAGWVYDASRRFGFSISDEEGVSASVSAEWTAASLGADGDASAMVVDVRGFRRAGPRHAVVAGRIAGARAWGDEPLRRVFGAGGSGAALPLLDFGLGAVALLRGFDAADVAGRTAIVGNVDYRVPIAWVERGVGTSPFFLRSLHGAVFADAGSAWDRARTTDDLRASFGAELAADVVIGYSLPLTVAGGVAIRHDPSGRSRGAAFFGRVGRAF